MGEIRWTDLGRKYIIKKGKRSILPDFCSAEKTYRQYYNTFSGGHLSPRRPIYLNEMIDDEEQKQLPLNLIKMHNTNNLNKSVDLCGGANIMNSNESREDQGEGESDNSDETGSYYGKRQEKVVYQPYTARDATFGMFSARRP